MTDKTEIIILRETIAECIISDLSAIAVFAAMFAPGLFFNSPAIQWVGGIVFMLWILGRAGKRKVIMSIAQARKFLDEIEAAQ